MKVFLDHNLPVQLKRELKGHIALTARALKWDRLRNGVLLAAAESAGFEVFLTGDQGIPHQRSQASRQISLVVLTRTRRKLVMAHSERILQALGRAVPGSLETVDIPDEKDETRAIE